MRTCRDCARTEPEIRFYASRRTHVCTECENTARTARRTGQYIDRFDVEARRAYMRRAKLASRYGITPEQYDAMLHEQGGACAACRRVPEADRRLCVDHDHDTGIVRGLLCDLCNRTLGQAGDDVEVLHRLVAYLESA